MSHVILFQKMYRYAAGVGMGREAMVKYNVALLESHASQKTLI